MKASGIIVLVGEGEWIVVMVVKANSIVVLVGKGEWYFSIGEWRPLVL